MYVIMISNSVTGYASLFTAGEEDFSGRGADANSTMGFNPYFAFRILVIGINIKFRLNVFYCWLLVSTRSHMMPSVFKYNFLIITLWVLTIIRLIFM